MNNKDSQIYLIEILLNAYSGELAAALAYNGHWKSLKNPIENELILMSAVEKEHELFFTHNI